MRSSLALAILLLAAPALAQAKKGAAPPPLSFDALLVSADELPADVQAVEGIFTVAPHPRSFYETPSVKELTAALPEELRSQIPREFFDGFPVPTRKESQSFKMDGGVAGSVFLFEYGTTDLSLVLAFLVPTLYGQKGRGAEHPEQLIVHDRFLWILSFPRADPSAEWYKARLRAKFRVPAPRDRPELDPLGNALATAFEAQDADAGLKILKENEAAVADWSFGQCMLGQFAEMKEDWKVAEKAFRKSLELHDTLADPLMPQLAWVSVDGLGLAVHAQRKHADAIKLFQRAIADAKALGDEDKLAVAQSTYNLACAYAMAKKYPDALKALKEAIALDPEYLETARTDKDFEAARKRKEFKAQLK